MIGSEKKTYDIIKEYHQNWNNDIKTYNDLIDLYNMLSLHKNKRILIKIKKVEFISANLLALLGCALDVSIINGNKVDFQNIHTNVKNLMQKNGFRRYFNWDSRLDEYHSTIEYKIFSATTENLEEFEKYILINIFNRKEMPKMYGRAKDVMIDNFLEMFNNVIDHAFSEKVFVCGQYFHKKQNLVLTIVDIGDTIKENVLNFLDNNEFRQDNTLKWAIISGNSTKQKCAPGGLGFSIILDFLELNDGCFTLISDNECYEVNGKGKRFLNMEQKFPGTIVTISFNLHDNSSYIYIDEEEEIIF